jgi:glycosyltransferase involved in cell wall biosynthesis
MDSILRTLGAFFENTVLKRANAFITISRTVASQISSLGIKSPILVSGNGIDIEFFNSVSETYACNDTVYDSIYVGRLDEGKGVLDLLEVWKTVASRLTKAKIAIVGNGKLRNKAEIFVMDNRLANNVKFLGYVDDIDLILTIRRSRLFVTLSTTEGWGLALAEALACGLPVVAYAISTLCETFGECSTVKFAEVGEKEQVAEIIIDHLTNSHYRKEDIAKVSKDFAARFDWKTVAAKEYETIWKSAQYFSTLALKNEKKT